MKRITFYLVAFFLVAFSWQGMAQTLNQNAGWPNANWTVTGTYNSDPNSFEADPTVVSNFAYDDDDGGSDVSNIEAESPVIDLTAASTAGEVWISVSGDYVYNYVSSPESLEIQYWDADTSSWAAWYAFPLSDTASAPSNDFCSGTSEGYTTPNLDIAAFTATQLSGFKYRIAYDDGGGWKYGFCFQSPTITSATPPSCPDVTNIMLSLDPVASSAGFSWDAVAGATGYNYEIQPQGTAQGDASVVASGNVANNSFTATTLVDGTDYTLYVQTDCGGSGTANYVSYNFSFILPPANDDCANAEALTVNTDFTCDIVTSGTLLGATDSGVSDNGSGTPNDDVWFSFMATETAHTFKMINKAGSYTDLVHEVMSGDCATLVSVNVSDNDVSEVSGLTVGDTYYVRVFGYSSTAGRDTTFDVCVGTLPPPPANDDACNAEMLTIGDAPTVGNNTSSTGQVDEPSPACWTDSTINSVWYSFVADGNDITVTTDFDTPLNDTSIAVYSATDCADFTTYTEVGCDTDGGDAGTFGWNSVVDLSGLTDGETYYVQVEGYGSKTDEFNIQVIYTPPTNDNICDAIALTMDATSASDAYTNFGATGEVDEPEGDCFSDGITGSVWFTFIAPASGGVNVTTNIPGGTNDDTEIAIYEAPTDCADATTMGTLLGCGQDTDANYLSEAFVAPLVAGDTYYVQVDNWDGTVDGGTFGIEVHEVTTFNPVFTTSVISDCTSSSDFSVDVDVTSLGGAATVTVTDGTTTNANVGLGVVSFGPYTAGTAVDFTVTSDDDATFTSTETVQYTCPPDNDLIGGAIPITPQPEGTACDSTTEFTARLQGDGATDSGLDGTCYGNNTGIDLFYTWTATSTGLLFSGGEGDPGIIIRDAATGDEIDCEQTFVTGVTLGGWAIGDNLIIQVYDFAGSDSNIKFCLSEVTLPSLPDCPTLVSPANGATNVTMRTDLVWEAATTGADPADSYDVYYGFGAGTPADTFWFNTTDTFVNGVLLLNFDSTVFNWKIVAKNAAGDSVGCTEFSFTSVAAADDYDGDGVINSVEVTGDATDTDMTDPCDPVQAAGYTGYDATNAIWMAADCDGDGMINGDESDYGSDPYDANSNGIDGLETVGFEYYPNPVNNNLTVKANESITSIAIFNMLGQQVKQVNPSSLNAQIDMTNLAKGTYFIKATVGERVGTFKIVKK